MAVQENARSRRVALTGMKVDLHIHSAASSHKDGKKVRSNTVANLPVLVKGLEENGINMCAVTDHDAFDPVLYRELKREESEDNCIYCVLPGVEFTVCFAGVGGVDTPIHVVTIFNDSSDDIADRIATSIPKGSDGKPAYDKEASFSEQEYWSIIRSIGASVILIAHQKKSLTSSGKPRKDDANSVGEDKFNEFLFMDYFEAYEYKNRGNEIHNKNYTYSNDVVERLRFVTGSDCHSWADYPGNAGERDEGAFPFTFLRCLPTFKGLAMAVTDVGRIRLTNNFFGSSAKKINEISMTIDGRDISVPLSPGINAIIGDNSIGKSLLISKLVSYKDVPPKKAKGYEDYLKKNDVVINTSISSEDYYKVDYQGDIRSQFEGLSDGKVAGMLAEHFPDDVDPAPFISQAKIEVGKYVSAIRSSLDYQKKMEEISSFVIPPERESNGPRSVKFTSVPKNVDTKSISNAIAEIRTIVSSIDKLLEDHGDIFNQDDDASLSAVKAELQKVLQRQRAKLEALRQDNAIREVIRSSVDAYKRKARKTIADEENAQQDFLSDRTLAVDTISELVVLQSKVKEFTFDFEDVEIPPNENPVGKYVFISRLSEKSLTPAILKKAVSGVLKSGQRINTATVTEEGLISAIKNYQPGSISALDYFEQRIIEELQALLAEEKAVVRDGDDVYSALSEGFDAQIYFALLADVETNRGVYIVDQPEDQISQKAIKKAVLEDFRDVSQYRQVILVTHNPQFIVNLDVDNVIFLSRTADGQLNVQSGALEYECEDYKILDVVAENIDGGLETIKKRMKRYEKAN